MTTNPSPLTSAQASQYESDGYCIVPNLLTRDEAMMVRGVILNHVLDPGHETSNMNNADPMDPMNTGTPAGRAARFRKLSHYGSESPLIWHQIYTHPGVLALARFFLDSDDVLLKFNAIFLKAARTGSATPWHQDNGLWRDGDSQAMNIWIAIDPATRANGCLQVIPGSHRQPIHPHLLYHDSLHGELPREAVESAKQAHGIDHIELEPGSALVWHSNLYHYSPPNTSDQSRIGIAGVFTTPPMAAQNPYHRRNQWVMEGGAIVHDFPPRPFEDFIGESQSMPPHAKVELVEA